MEAIDNPSAEPLDGDLAQPKSNRNFEIGFLGMLLGILSYLLDYLFVCLLHGHRVAPFGSSYMEKGCSLRLHR